MRMERGVGPCPLGRRARRARTACCLGREDGKETPGSGATLWAMPAWSALGTSRCALGVLRNCRI